MEYVVLFINIFISVILFNTTIRAIVSVKNKQKPKITIYTSEVYDKVSTFLIHVVFFISANISAYRAFEILKSII